MVMVDDDVAVSFKQEKREDKAEEKPAVECACFTCPSQEECKAAQEAEGAELVRDFLSTSGMTEEQIGRVAYLVGHHHTFSNIDRIDYQILVEADYIANATENGYSVQNVESFIQKTMNGAATCCASSEACPCRPPFFGATISASFFPLSSSRT